MANLPRTLGELLRDARTDKKLSLRELARQLDKTPSYLSDIENDRRVPSEEVLRDLAGLLDLQFDEVMALAGRVGENAERYLKRSPAAAMLFRRISEANLPESDVKKLIGHAEKMSRQKPEGQDA